MPVPTITLTGDALYGLHPDGLPEAMRMALPHTVCLGRNRPAARPQALRLEAFVKKIKDVPIPPAVDWYTKAQVAIARMYMNDTYGCCVFSGKAHNLGIWSANDPDSAGGQVVMCTDRELTDQYFAYTGGRDDGAIISEVLDYMRSPGFTAGGKKYTIDGYVSCDWRSKELTQIGLALFGCGSIGIDLPSAWTNDAVWDVTNTRSVGGHDVSPCGYGAKILGTNADGVAVSSWGRLYLITWAAWTSTRWLDELYFAVPTFLWTGLDKRAPSGVDLTTLKDDLQKIGGGTLPPLPGPDPVPPTPVPPVPPTPVPPAPVVFPPYSVTLTGSFPKGGLFGGHETVTLTGTAVPAAGRSPLGWDLSNVNWWGLIQDGAKLFVDWQKQDFAAVAQDVQRILGDLGLFGEKLIALNVNWFAVLADLMKLFVDYQTKNVPGMVLDVQQLLKDLGITLPFHPIKMTAFG